MPPRSNGLREGAIGSQKPRRRTGGWAPWPTLRPWTRVPMRVVTPVIAGATRARGNSRLPRALRRALALALLRDDPPRGVLPAVEALAETLLRRRCVPSAVPQESEPGVGLLASVPQGVTLALARHQALVQLPG